MEVLARTMFAPTVTGSPLVNACRVIAKYEPTGRAYYAGVVALVGRDAGGRKARLGHPHSYGGHQQGGLLRLDVGATLVRQSGIRSIETEFKAAALLTALGLAERPRVMGDPPVRHRREPTLKCITSSPRGIAACRATG